MTTLRTTQAEPGAGVLAAGWVPKDGWRWASDSEMTLKGEEYLVASEKWLQVAEKDGPRWLVPVGELRRVAIRPATALQAFLRLGALRPDLPVEAFPRLRIQIADFAARYGWLGRPQQLILAKGGSEVQAEAIHAWLEEIVLLGRLSRLLNTCERIERSDAVPRRSVIAAHIGQLTEAASVAGVTWRTTANSGDLIDELRGGVRAILTRRLSGQFSVWLLDRVGEPIERYVPSTLAATLELALGRQAVGKQEELVVCPGPGCQTLFRRGRGGDGKTSNKYHHPSCARRAYRLDPANRAREARARRRRRELAQKGA